MSEAAIYADLTCQVVMQLNGDNLTAIPDDYRKEQIDFINDNAVLFHH